MTTDEYAYIAGFLDGDGCIMFQLIYRHDYIYKYQIRASIVFYQKTKHREILEWLHSKLAYGYIRNRNDGMSEYTIVGIRQVMDVLERIASYIRLKKKHVELARKISALIPQYKRTDPKILLKAAAFVDQFVELNYSKKRQNTKVTLEKSLKDEGYIPRND